MERFCEKYCKNTIKVRGHYHWTSKYRGAAHSIYNLKGNIPKETPIVFHNGSNYDYHFIMQRLGKNFKGEFSCLGEDTEKYSFFSTNEKGD